MTIVDSDTLDCWRANYCLTMSPHALHEYWSPGAPPGAALALRAAVAEIERLLALVASWEAKAATWLASPEAAKRLEGYRELSRQISDQQEEIQRLRKDAERYRWLAIKHGWWLLKHFPAVRPYLDASEVFDESIDAAMKEAP